MIYRAHTNFEWPGEASVIVSEIHVHRGPYDGTRHLNDQEVPAITSLLTGYIDLSIAQKLAHRLKYSEGVKLYDGGAFIVSKEKTERLMDYNPGIKRYLRVYVNGDVLNDTPNCNPLMHAIDFGEEEDYQIKKCDDALTELKTQVLQARKKQIRQIHEYRPWLHWDKRTEFLLHARRLLRIIAVTIVSTQYAFHMVDPNHLYAHGIKLFADDRVGLWGLLQSRVHETWARAITSSRGKSLRYTTSSCFDTFSFLEVIIENPDLARVAQDYLEFRTKFLVSVGSGTTAFYGDLFHNPVQRTEEIQRLRDLHARMDQIVLQAYGWDDLADRAAPEFLTKETEPDHRYQGRLFWPAPFRDEVLARLLDLNHARAEEERHLGLSPRRAAGEDEEATEEADSLL